MLFEIVYFSTSEEKCDFPGAIRRRALERERAQEKRSFLRAVHKIFHDTNVRCTQNTNANFYCSFVELFETLLF